MTTPQSRGRPSTLKPCPGQKNRMKMDKASGAWLVSYLKSKLPPHFVMHIAVSVNIPQKKSN